MLSLEQIMEKEFLLLLGKKIRTLREERNFSLTEFAKKASMSARFLIQIEKGKANPSIRVLYHIAQVFGISISLLFQQENTGRHFIRDSQISYGNSETQNMIDTYAKLSERNRKKALQIMKLLSDE